MRREPTQHSRSQVGQIFGKARPEFCGGRTVHPHPRRRRKKCVHALREETQNQSAENVSGTGCGQGGRRVAVDDGAAVGGGDHGVAALQYDDGPAASCRGASSRQLIARGIE